MNIQVYQDCPLCGQDNNCRVAKGELYKGECWCHRIVVPEGVLRRMAEEMPDRGCLCQPCLETLSQVSVNRGDFDAVLVEARAQIVRRRISEGADFYLDEFGNTVFTPTYHLKRGNCCGSGCRHCPY